MNNPIFNELKKTLMNSESDFIATFLTLNE